MLGDYSTCLGTSKPIVFHVPIIDYNNLQYSVPRRCRDSVALRTSDRGRAVPNDYYSITNRSPQVRCVPRLVFGATAARRLAGTLVLSKTRTDLFAPLYGILRSGTHCEHHLDTLPCPLAGLNAFRRGFCLQHRKAGYKQWPFVDRRRTASRRQ